MRSPARLRAQRRKRIARVTLCGRCGGWRLSAGRVARARLRGAAGQRERRDHHRPAAYRRAAQATHARGFRRRRKKYRQVPKISAAPSTRMARGEVGYLPRASPGGGRSTTKPPAAAASVGPEFGPARRKSIPARLTRLLSGRQLSPPRALNGGSARHGSSTASDRGRPVPEAC